jgi:preprotein translocase subunit SecA
VFSLIASPHTVMILANFTLQEKYTQKIETKSSSQRKYLYQYLATQIIQNYEKFSPKL